MSYHRSSLGSIQSRVYGRTVAPRGPVVALGSIQSRVYGRTVAPRGMGGFLDKFLPQPVQEPQLPIPETEEGWRSEMLKSQRQVAFEAKKWVEQDKLMRTLQLVATVTIPVSGLVWKWLLGRRAGNAAASITTP